MTFNLAETRCVRCAPGVHVLGAREGFQGPVEEAVEEDEAGTRCPDNHDGDEGHTKVIDDLGHNNKDDRLHYSFLKMFQILLVRVCVCKRACVCYLDSREGDSRRGIRADHQSNECRTQITKHVRELKGEKERERESFGFQAFGL